MLYHIWFVYNHSFIFISTTVRYLVRLKALLVQVIESYARSLSHSTVHALWPSEKVEFGQVKMPSFYHPHASNLDEL